MNKYQLTVFFFLTIVSIGIAQPKVQWAGEVTEFSSQRDEKQFSANQISGKPNVYPWGSENPSAWMPSTARKSTTGDEFIRFNLAEPMPIRQIAVAESFNPGALKEVYVYDATGTADLLIQRPARKVDRKGRFVRLYADLTEFEVHSIKLVFQNARDFGGFAIDAVGVSDGEEPIDLVINLPDNLILTAIAERLSENVNSEYAEINPILSPDGKTLFFGRKNHPGNLGGIGDYEDIWYSEWDEEKQEWGLAKNAGAPLNTKQPNFISSITPDGNTMVLLLGNAYSEKGNLSSGVSMSRKEGNSWSKPRPLEIDNFYNNSMKANFFLANSRKSLLMSIEREDSYGDRDLYVSFLQLDGRWSPPLNLGPIVNTANEESAPFLAADDRTLFFSSNGFPGYGGTDIFVTRRLDDTWQNWSEPENMGSAVNSSEDDIFFNLPPIGDYGYFNRGNTDENSDIYRIQLPLFFEPDPVIRLSGRIINSKTGQPMEAQIIYESLEDGRELGIATSDPITGEYEIVLPAGTNYSYVAKVPGFLPAADNVDATKLKESIELGKDIELVAVEKAAKITLNNIFFAFDSYRLLDTSLPELKRIVTVMEENPDIKIMIKGHTDNIGEARYNMTLSERRAKAVVDYLRKNGVEKDRISYKGFGLTQPIVPNDTPDNRRKNRRVEFEVL
jgi:OmpA-OmpF porin, OOP family